MKKSILFALLFLPLFVFGQHLILPFKEKERPTYRTYEVTYFKTQKYVRAGYPEFWEQKEYSEVVYGVNLLFSYSKDKMEVTIYDGVELLKVISNRYDGQCQCREDYLKNKITVTEK